MMFNMVHNQNVAASCIKCIWPTSVALPLLENKQTNKTTNQPKKPLKKSPKPTTTDTKKPQTQFQRKK